MRTADGCTIGSFDKSIKIIDPSNKKIVATLKGHKDAITCLTQVCTIFSHGTTHPHARRVLMNYGAVVSMDN